MSGEGSDQFDPHLAEGWKRHAFIISRTAPAFLLMGIFFLFRWVLIGGDRSGEFFRTAIIFTAVGIALAILSAVVRRPVENEQSF